jgi:hypothetical protein
MDAGSSTDAGGCTTQTPPSCQCADAGGYGFQVCDPTTGNWGACNCNSYTNADADTNPDNAPCKAGYYTGTFDGDYWPGIFDLGFGSLAMVTIKAKGDANTPGLAMTLEKHVEGEGGEFVTYTVSDGCMIGTAEAAGTDNPFVAVISGSLDCNTGTFTGTIRGYYDLFAISQLPFHFEGPISAHYMPTDPNPTLGDGMWMVSETQAASEKSPPGGSGTWSVTYTSDQEGMLASQCAELLAADGGMAGDAGGTSDAGI